MNETRKRNFDPEAGSWDDNPVRVKLASDVLGSIAREVALTPEMDVLDFGCGTGLVSLPLRPLVRSVTGVDSSQGMLEVLRKKIARQGIAGVETHPLDLEQGDRLKGRYHLIVSSMTLHHIRDIRALIGQFHAALLPSGYLCLADLDPDKGLFHDTAEGVFHQGFERTALRDVLRQAGFDDVRDVTAAEVVKPGADGITRKFSVFLVLGRKPAGVS